MALPDYQSIMLPLLQFASDQQEHSNRETLTALAKTFQLTPSELSEMLPSGRQTVFTNRVGWARTYLKKAGLLTSTRRGYFQISKRGSDTLQQNLTHIDNRFLMQFPEFIDFKERKNSSESPKVENSEIENVETPEEGIESAYLRVRQTLAKELLHTVITCSPDFFEQLVIDLLIKMGYGGTRKDAGEAIGGSGDGGIDGIIKEDRLGLDIVYIQAKRWDVGNTIGRPEIQKFAGALQGQRARKGIFITTSEFTKTAKEYVSMIENKIVLIDGETLSELMIDFDIGVSTIASFDLKRIDTDYFAED